MSEAADAELRGEYWQTCFLWPRDWPDPTSTSKRPW